MESLPIVFWTFYAVLFLITFVTSLIYWIKQRYSGLAAIGIIFSFIIPLVSLVYTAQRNTGTEYQYLKEKLASWDWLAIAIIIGHLVIVGWVFLVLIEGLKKAYHVPFINKKLSPFFREKLHPLWNKWTKYVKGMFQKKDRKKEHVAEEKERDVQ